MAKVLCAWELGGGSGHFVNLRPLVRGLAAEGHKVFVALRDLCKGPALLEGAAVSYLQSPYKSDRPRNVIEPARTFAHILHNIGFGDPAELAALVDAWRNLIDLVDPDLIVFDHSPTALLAGRGSKARRVVLGNSFSSPPDCSPFPDLRPWLPADPNVFQTENTVLENANRVLCGRGQPTLERLGRLYGEVDEVILTTLAEFDHYPNRAPARYRGPWMPEGGEVPAWPSASGKKVFAYLKTFPALPQLLTLLRQMACPTIVHIDGITAELQRQHASPTLCFQTNRLDLHRAAAECDLAILNGTHGSTVLTLLAGKPALQLPLVLEQDLNARATVRLGAGARVSPWQGQGLAVALSGLLQSDAYTEAARRFAARYAQHSPREESQRAVADLLSLLGFTAKLMASSGG
ncbi:MAG: hypothetical protein ABSG68_06635 [Thermoguttaceae bacterium]